VKVKLDEHLPRRTRVVTELGADKRYAKLAFCD